jgi:hypothetical protein
LDYYLVATVERGTGGSEISRTGDDLPIAQAKVMAQTCFQCSGLFDDSARFCPGCGFPAPPQEVLAVEEPPVEHEELEGVEGSPQPAEPMSLTHPNSLIGAFVVFAVMVTVGLGMSGSKSSSGGSSYDDGKTWAITMAQAFVKERLKSPSSASFPWSYDEYRVSHIGSEWCVSGYVDAVNGFNANLRTRWSLRMRDEGEDWRLLSIDIQ